MRDSIIVRDNAGHVMRRTSVGCYPLFYMCADGEVLCPLCVESEGASETHEDTQWRIVACDANWEDPLLYCAHCNKRIESAYAEEGK
jgi:hypothetical protein